MSGVRVVTLPEEPGFEAAPGAFMRCLVGAGAMLNLVDLEPNGEVALHSHPHEQLGYVIEGLIVMDIDGVEYSLEPGRAYVIPGGVEHSGKGGPDGCRVLDIFLPVRDDYVTKLAGAG